MERNKIVFVTGCFDMLHSGHVAFLTEAATYGDVIVGLGSDETVYNLKGRYPVNNQDERKYMLEALSAVTQCIINKGSGLIDYENELEEIKPDYFIVNEDGGSPVKEELTKKLGIEYIVLRRIPHANLPARSTTAMRRECTIPFRIDLAGGWLDQPYVGKFAPGPVLTIAIEPTIEFNERSGMSSSTRRRAIELWSSDIPAGNREQLAKILFSFENPPGTKTISGSQDAIGIVHPGLNRLDYSGNYWPDKIASVSDEETLSWIEKHLYLITLEPREAGYDVLSGTNITPESAIRLADSATCCWDAIIAKDLKNFGRFFFESFQAQIAMFPNMVDPIILKTIDSYKQKSLGLKLSGAGGGGYIILVSDKPVEKAMQIKIRRNGL